MRIREDETAIGMRIAETADAIVMRIPEGPTGKPYAGPYEVTPTEAQQTLPTKGALLKEDITVKMIPADYGKVSDVGGIIYID